MGCTGFPILRGYDIAGTQYPGQTDLIAHVPALCARSTGVFSAFSIAVRTMRIQRQQADRTVADDISGFTQPHGFLSTWPYTLHMYTDVLP